MSGKAREEDEEEWEREGEGKREGERGGGGENVGREWQLVALGLQRDQL